MNQTAQQQDLLARLPDSVTEEGPSWLVGIRREGLTHLHEKGFPNKKDEAWKFTPVRPITSVPFTTASARHSQQADVGWVDGRFGDDGTWRLSLVNGRPRLAGAGVVPDGVEVTSLAEVLAERPDLVAPHLGKYSSAEHFRALNAAMFDDGLVLRVRRGAVVEQPVHLVHVGLAAGEPTAAYPRLVVLVEEGAELSLVESYCVAEGEKHLTNVVGEMAIGRNANVDHVRIVEGASNGFHIGAFAVHQERDSRYNSHVATLGGTLSRLDLDVSLDGEGAECRLDGVYHVGGNEHVDHHTFIDHTRPNCTSRENYRGLLDGKGHAVFDGTIFVRRDSQHTSAHQENRNLLLSDDAQAHTKPHLQIDADDVKCSHGATVGALDESPLFYLRARGIDESRASAILTYAFVRAVVDKIRHEPVRRRIGEALLARMPHGNDIRELL